AYGNVRSILQTCEKITTWLGSAPYQSIKESSDLSSMPPLVHRWTRCVDIKILMHWMRIILQTHTSLENYFFCKGSGFSTKQCISHFVTGMLTLPLPK